MMQLAKHSGCCRLLRAQSRVFAVRHLHTSSGHTAPAGGRRTGTLARAGLLSGLQSLLGQAGSKVLAS